ncbi:MAG: tetratricopeptide repeat protein, partial [Pyrinomonadaceae bacterium]
SLCLKLEENKEPPKWVEQAKASAWAHLGFLTAIEGEYTIGLEYLQKALDLSKKLDTGVSQKAIITDRLIDIGQVYHLISEYNQALNYYTQAKVIAQDLDDKTPYVRVLTRLSTLYRDHGYNLGDNLKSTKYSDDSLQLATKTTDKRYLIRILINVGVGDQKEGKYENAVKHFQQALELAEASGEVELILLARKGLGTVAQAQGDYKSVQQTYDRALKHAEQINSKEGEIEFLWKKADAYWSQKDYAHALEYSESVLKLAGEIDSPNFTYLALTLKGKIYLAQREYDLASQSLTQAI